MEFCCVFRNLLQVELTEQVPTNLNKMHSKKSWEFKQNCMRKIILKITKTLDSNTDKYQLLSQYDKN